MNILAILLAILSILLVVIGFVMMFVLENDDKRCPYCWRKFENVRNKLAHIAKSH